MANAMAGVWGKIAPMCDFGADSNSKICKTGKILSLNNWWQWKRSVCIIFCQQRDAQKHTLYHLLTCKSHKPWAAPLLLNGPHRAHLFYSFLILLGHTLPLPFIEDFLNMTFLCVLMDQKKVWHTLQFPSFSLFFYLEMHHFLKAKNHYHCIESLESPWFVHCFFLLTAVGCLFPDHSSFIYFPSVFLATHAQTWCVSDKNVGSCKNLSDMNRRACFTALSFLGLVLMPRCLNNLYCM